MSSKDFLKQMNEAGKKFDSGGGGLGCIGQMKVEFGFHGFKKGCGHDFWFAWRPASDVDDMERAFVEAQAKLNEHKVEAQARFGIKITVFKEALTGPYSRDLAEFTPEWQAEGHKMLMDTLIKNDIPANKVFWGQTAQKANPYNVAKGEKGKTDTDQNGNPSFPTIRIPVKVFKDEAAARKFMEGQGGASDSQSPSFSDTAKANYKDISQLEGLSNQINEWMTKAQNGTAYNEDAENFPLPVPPTPLNLKNYIAEIYAIESSDVDLLIPF